MHNWRRCATDVPCNFTIKSLALLAFVYLNLMSLASGIAVPGGLFMPSIMVRAVLAGVSAIAMSRVGAGARTWCVRICSEPLDAACSGYSCQPHIRWNAEAGFTLCPAADFPCIVLRQTFRASCCGNFSKEEEVMRRDHRRAWQWCRWAVHSAQRRVWC